MRTGRGRADQVGRERRGNLRWVGESLGRLANRSTRGAAPSRARHLRYAGKRHLQVTPEPAPGPLLSRPKGHGAGDSLIRDRGTWDTSRRRGTAEAAAAGEEEVQRRSRQVARRGSTRMTAAYSGDAPKTSAAARADLRAMWRKVKMRRVRGERPRQVLSASRTGGATGRTLVISDGHKQSNVKPKQHRVDVVWCATEGVWGQATVSAVDMTTLVRRQADTACPGRR